MDSSATSSCPSIFFGCKLPGLNKRCDFRFRSAQPRGGFGGGCVLHPLGILRADLDFEQGNLRNVLHPRCRTSLAHEVCGLKGQDVACGAHRFVSRLSAGGNAAELEKGRSPSISVLGQHAFRCELQFGVPFVRGRSRLSWPLLFCTIGITTSSFRWACRNRSRWALSLDSLSSAIRGLGAPWPGRRDCHAPSR